MPATVSLRTNFCPICFRGPGAVTTRVPHDSPRINHEQRQCSLVTRGLPLLDLSAEGCKCERQCTLICLACGNPMAFPCETDYHEVFDATDQFEEDELETRGEVFGGFLEELGKKMLAAAERRLQRRLAPLGLAWHPGWRKPLHARCLKKNVCGCMLSIGFSACPIHIQARVLPRRAPRAAQPMPPAQPKPVEQKRATPARRVVMMEASWLPKPTNAATVCSHPSLPPPPAIRKLPAPKSKPNPRLVSAAQGCQRLDVWRASPAHPKQVAGTRPPFDMRKYERDFDPFKHGYFRKNGEEFFLFPDGWTERVTSAVNHITDEGRLVPG